MIGGSDSRDAGCQSMVSYSAGKKLFVFFNISLRPRHSRKLMSAAGRAGWEHGVKSSPENAIACDISPGNVPDKLPRARESSSLESYKPKLQRKKLTATVEKHGGKNPSPKLGAGGGPPESGLKL